MKSNKRRPAKNRFPVLISVSLIIFALFLPVVIFLLPQKSPTEQQTQAAAVQSPHFFAAFSAGSSPSIAASVGLNAILDYGYDPVVGDAKSTALKAANLQIIDQMPDEYLRQYDKDGNLQSLLASMTSHLKSVQNNSQVIAYWVLDDWSHDGTAKNALQQMNSLIHQYTPGKPSICGFSGNSDNYNGKTMNFSPTGCDMVGLYIYPQSAAEFSLPTILPALEAGLKAQGWNIAANPLVGVPLSYGGANGYAVPTASQVETETKAFCQAGATAIIYYDFGTGTNGSNNSGIQQGIKTGIADCTGIWGNTSTSPNPQTSNQPITQPSTIIPSFVCGGSQNCAGPTPTIFNGGSGPVTSAAPDQTATSTPVPALTSAPGADITATPAQGSGNGGNGNNPVTQPGNGTILKLIEQILKLISDLFKQLFGNIQKLIGHRPGHKK